MRLTAELSCPEDRSDGAEGQPTGYRLSGSQLETALFGGAVATADPTLVLRILHDDAGARLKINLEGTTRLLDVPLTPLGGERYSAVFAREDARLIGELSVIEGALHVRLDEGCVALPGASEEVCGDGWLPLVQEEPLTLELPAL